MEVKRVCESEKRENVCVREKEREYCMCVCVCLRERAKSLRVEERREIMLRFRDIYT